MTDWTAVQGTLEEDLVNTRVGTKSLKFTVDPAVGTGHMTKVINQTFDADKPLRLYFYVSNQVTPTEYIRIFLAKDAGLTNNLSYDINQLTKGLHTGWNSVDIYPDEWTENGTAALTDTFIRLRFLLGPEVGTVQIVSFDSFEKGLVNKPCVMLTFDDVWESVYYNAFPEMHGRGIQGTVYPVSDYIGNTNYCTAAQLQALSAAGWCIGNHTKDHPHLDTLSLADAKTSLQGCKDALDALGLTQNSMDVAYPFGDIDQVVLDAMADLGWTCGRTIKQYGTFIPGKDNDLVIGGWSVHNTDSLATVEAFVDNCITYNRPISLIFHEITPVASTTYQWPAADFVSLLDYCIAQDLGFMTIQDYKDLKNGNVTT